MWWAAIPVVGAVGWWAWDRWVKPSAVLARAERDSIEIGKPVLVLGTDGFADSVRLFVTGGKPRGDTECILSELTGIAPDVEGERWDWRCYEWRNPNKGVQRLSELADEGFAAAVIDHAALQTDNPNELLAVLADKTIGPVYLVGPSRYAPHGLLTRWRLDDQGQFHRRPFRGLPSGATELEE